MRLGTGKTVVSFPLVATGVSSRPAIAIVIVSGPHENKMEADFSKNTRNENQQHSHD